MERNGAIGEKACFVEEEEKKWAGEARHRDVCGNEGRRNGHSILIVRMKE